MKDRIFESLVVLAIWIGFTAMLIAGAIPTLVVIAIGKISGRNYLDERHG